MTVAVAAYYELPCPARRVFPLSDILRVVRPVQALAEAGLGAVAIGLSGLMVMLAAAWMLNTAISVNPQLHGRMPVGPGALALAQSGPSTTAGEAASFEAKWTGMAAVLPAMPLMPVREAELHVTHEQLASRELAQIKKITPAAVPGRLPESAPPLPPKRPRERADSVPLPPPVPQQLAQARIKPAAPPRVALALPPPAPIVARPVVAKPIVEKPIVEKPVVAKPVKPQQEAHNKSLALPATDSRTAVYDISAHTVYLPDGSRLEAHSGLGEKMDDPRYIKVRMRGPTPPNVYALTLREELFHGVRAIRLNPVNDDKMYGRAGMLAHTYMLGPNGQSNGCVSFRDYDKFLHAFLKGEVDRLVVVANLGNSSPAVARRNDGDRFAANY
jgi:hypothetical protein